MLRFAAVALIALLASVVLPQPTGREPYLASLDIDRSPADLSAADSGEGADAPASQLPVFISNGSAFALFDPASLELFAADITEDRFAGSDTHELSWDDQSLSVDAWRGESRRTEPVAGIPRLYGDLLVDLDRRFVRLYDLRDSTPGPVWLPTIPRFATTMNVRRAGDELILAVGSALGEVVRIGNRSGEARYRLDAAPFSDHLPTVFGVAVIDSETILALAGRSPQQLIALEADQTRLIERFALAIAEQHSIAWPASFAQDPLRESIAVGLRGALAVVTEGQTRLDAIPAVRHVSGFVGDADAYAAVLAGSDGAAVAIRVPGHDEPVVWSLNSPHARLAERAGRVFVLALPKAGSATRARRDDLAVAVEVVW